MAAFEVIALDTATPQLRAPGASDTYTFPRAVEMPLGTANGVLYLNGSKVVTSGSVLTFDGTNFTYQSAISLINNDGSGNRALVTPFAYGGSGATGTLVLSSTYGNANQQRIRVGVGGAAAISFDIDSAEGMRLTSTGLGIGTSSPVGKLDTRGTAYLGSDSNNSLVVDSTSSTVTIAAAGRTAFSTSALRFLTSDGTAALERMRLDSSGNLGLGVTPSAWAASARTIDFAFPSVAMDTTGAAVLGFNAYNSSGTTWNYKSTDEAALFTITNAGAFTWRQAASGTAGNAISFTQAMTLHASGGLSVGSTSDPGANTIALTKLSIKVDGPFFTGANIDSGSNQLGIGVSSGTAAVGLFTANTERIRIKSQGQLRYIPLAADPAGAENGDVYYNSTTNKLRVYAGGAWVDLH